MAPIKKIPSSPAESFDLFEKESAQLTQSTQDRNDDQMGKALDVTEEKQDEEPYPFIYALSF